MCETTVRAAHACRKRKRKHQEISSSDVESSSENSVSEAAEEDSIVKATKQGRIRRNFLNKVFSPVIGYGADYDLLHFVYDLSMWTTIGAKKNIGGQHDIPMRVMLKNSPLAPEYWKVRLRFALFK